MLITTNETRLEIAQSGFCCLPMTSAWHEQHLLLLLKCVAHLMHDAIQSGQQSTVVLLLHKHLLANIVMQASVETLREQVRLLRSHRQRAVVLANLPALRPEAQTHARSKGPSQGCAALDLARRLQLEPAQTPKVCSFPACVYATCSFHCAENKHLAIEHCNGSPWVQRLWVLLCTQRPPGSLHPGIQENCVVSQLIFLTHTQRSLLCLLLWRWVMQRS